MQPDMNYTNPNVYKNPAREALSRLLIVGAVLCGVLLLMWITWNQTINKHTVTFKPKPGTVIQIGTIKRDDNGDGIQRVLAQTPQATSVRLKAGDYEVFYGGKDYVSDYERIHLDGDVILTTPALKYSDNKLKSLLQQQLTTIHASLATSANMTVYTPQKERLFYDGSWYTSLLMPADTAVYDPQVVVMHKEDGQWKVVAGPKIVLYKGDYPNVPEEILRNANNVPVDITAPAE